MARSQLGILIVLLLPIASALTVTDNVDDVQGNAGVGRADEPGIDIRIVTAELDNGTLSLSMQMAGPAPGRGVAPANESILFSYLFLVAVGVPEDTNILRHVSSGGDTLAVRCTFHQGISDLACDITAGDGTLRAAGIDQANVTARVEVPWTGDYALGAGATKNEGPDGNTTVVAQDFTDNALPDAMREPPGDGMPTAERDPPRPWWASSRIIILAALIGVVVGGAVLWVRRD